MYHLFFHTVLFHLFNVIYENIFANLPNTSSLPRIIFSLFSFYLLLMCSISCSSSSSFFLFYDNVLQTQALLILYIIIKARLNFYDTLENSRHTENKIIQKHANILWIITRMR